MINSSKLYEFEGLVLYNTNERKKHGLLQPNHCICYNSCYLGLLVEQLVQNIAEAHLIALNSILTTLAPETNHFNLIHRETVKMMSKTSIFNNFILAIKFIKIPYIAVMSTTWYSNLNGKCDTYKK